MSGVFLNIDPHPHPLASVYPPPLVRGEDTLAGGRRGGGSIVRKTPDTALYSMYICTVSTLWCIHMFRLCLLHPLFSSFRRHAAPSIETVTKAAPKHFNDSVRYVKKKS
jgi:hypothetical protein